MSREWKPGDVATIGTRPLLYIGGERWADSFGCQLPLTAEEPRPLVVIDPEDREALELLMDLQQTAEIAAHPGMRIADCLSGSCWVDTMQAALREYANPTPRPDEPQGLGAVVEDEDGAKWVRNHGSLAPWRHTLRGENERPWRYYADIAAVRVLSPGVEVDQ